jgi:hypothetical protein
MPIWILQVKTDFYQVWGILTTLSGSKPDNHDIDRRTKKADKKDYDNGSSYKAEVLF